MPLVRQSIPLTARSGCASSARHASGYAYRWRCGRRPETRSSVRLGRFAQGIRASTTNKHERNLRSLIGHRLLLRGGLRLVRGAGPGRSYRAVRRGARALLAVRRRAGHGHRYLVDALRRHEGLPSAGGDHLRPRPHRIVLDRRHRRLAAGPVHHQPQQADCAGHRRRGVGDGRRHLPDALQRHVGDAHDARHQL